ncbi:uncharacterized protein THITE_2122411 [Thermothielavioides terrestris NRRL 8126]|uniref:Transcription factor domain-containing protein n=1 Tax=Thermothielavioides terrestris (strain ATCC 38088 / NRRL 8126) TaxID=578455 RepID=G2RD18_THETT|nr:uncharacterized protein THITE_2122411 [Thermothielavioides terrestris NRRL 8126]AEO70711.1 hypothetical protein THITE_2122411 [Thermothielavioides terrestris NRRL 8126]
MCTILCLAATHFSVVQPLVPRYSRAALQLLGKAARLFSERLSCPVTTQNSEALISASFLMQYISWSHLGFLDDHDQFDLSADPLFRLSSGVRGVLAEAIPNLSGSDNPFLTASLYSPKGAITSAIVQRGLDPRAYVRQFMALWDDPAYGPVHSGNDAETSPEQFVSPLGCPKPPCRSHSQTQASLHPQHSSDPRRTAFERIAERLSLLLCLVAMSGVTDEHSPSEDLVRLRPEIERCFLTFPVLYSRVFRGRALQDDPRAPVTLYHFYRAARILLDSPTAWWAGQRSRVFESRILRELQSRGLCMCVSVELGQSTLIQAG